MPGIPSLSKAEHVAAELLSDLEGRWLHTRRVATRAAELAASVPDCDRDLLVVAAWWHDLGYSRELRVTGLHQLDGARYLTEAGYPERLCSLVAHHSAATFEAEERGMAGALDEWPREEGPVADALWMSDMTTGPRGEDLDYPDRLDEILKRYSPDSVVSRAMTRARPKIEAAIDRARVRLLEA